MDVYILFCCLVVVNFERGGVFLVVADNSEWVVVVYSSMSSVSRVWRLWPLADDDGEGPTADFCLVERDVSYAKDPERPSRPRIPYFWPLKGFIIVPECVRKNTESVGIEPWLALHFISTEKQMADLYVCRRCQKTEGFQVRISKRQDFRLSSTCGHFITLKVLTKTYTRLRRSFTSWNFFSELLTTGSALTEAGNFYRARETSSALFVKWELKVWRYDRPSIVHYVWYRLRVFKEPFKMQRNEEVTKIPTCRTLPLVRVLKQSIEWSPAVKKPPTSVSQDRTRSLSFTL